VLVAEIGGLSFWRFPSYRNADLLSTSFRVWLIA